MCYENVLYNMLFEVFYAMKYQRFSFDNNSITRATKDLVYSVLKVANPVLQWTIYCQDVSFCRIEQHNHETPLPAKLRVRYFPTKLTQKRGLQLSEYRTWKVMKPDFVHSGTECPLVVYDS